MLRCTPFIIPVCLAAVGINLLQPNPSSAAKRCTLPKTLGRIYQPKGTPLISVKDTDGIYTLWSVVNTSTRPKTTFQAVLKTGANNKCFVSFSNHSGDAGTMTKGVPKNIAKTFAYYNFKSELQKTSREDMQKTLNSMSSQDVLFPEERDALIALKFNVPSKIKVYPYWTKPLEQYPY